MQTCIGISEVMFGSGNALLEYQKQVLVEKVLQTLVDGIFYLSMLVVEFQLQDGIELGVMIHWTEVGCCCHERAP